VWVGRRDPTTDLRKSYFRPVRKRWKKKRRKEAERGAAGPITLQSTVPAPEFSAASREAGVALPPSEPRKIRFIHRGTRNTAGTSGSRREPYRSRNRVKAEPSFTKGDAQHNRAKVKRTWISSLPSHRKTPGFLRGWRTRLPRNRCPICRVGPRCQQLTYTGKKTRTAPVKGAQSQKDSRQPSRRGFLGDPGAAGGK